MRQLSGLVFLTLLVQTAWIQAVPQVLQTSVTSPVLQVPLGGQMTVTTAILSPSSLADLSVMSAIYASNGANWAYQTLVASVTANTRKDLTITFTVPTNAYLSTGPATLVIEVYQNSGWVQLVRNDPIPFVLTAATTTTTTTPATTTTTTPATTTTTTTHATTTPATTTTTTTPATTTKPAATLLWADEFTTLSLAASLSGSGNWMVNDYTWQSPTSGYQDFAGTNWNLNPFDSTTSPYTPFAVSNGILTISAFRTPSAINSAIQAEKIAQGVPGGVPAWCGGMLASKQSFLNGYFEIKATWPNSGKGMFPALWLYASQGSLDPQQKGAAEIDILELPGAPNTIHTTIHWHYNNGTGKDQELGTISRTTSQWHIFGLDRQTNYLRFYVDGTLVYEVTGADAVWFNGVQMAVRLNYAMDAPWFASLNLASDATTPSPLQLQIDYVRVYNFKP